MRDCRQIKLRLFGLSVLFLPLEVKNFLMELFTHVIGLHNDGGRSKVVLFLDLHRNEL